MSLISDEQYVNVARDVFGVTFEGDVTTQKSTSGEYGFSEIAEVSKTSTQAYLTAAEQIAGKIKPCGANPVTAACVQAYLTEKLPLAWRRPVDKADIDGLMTIFNGAMADGAPRALSLTMQAALGSPGFLYRTEIGASAAGPGDKTTLTPHELAAAVSFAALDSIPDPELWSKAQDGTLVQPDVLKAQVERILTLPAARANLKKKVSYLLNFEKLPFTNKDPKDYGAFTASLKDSLYQSTQKFLDDVMWSGKFSDLLTSRRLYANQEIAAAYGIPGVTGSQLVAVETTGDAYNAGILTQPALLATSNHHADSDDIVHRGLWVYNNIACGVTIGEVPDNATAEFAKLMGTQREKALKRNAMSCGACHKSFDPFGLVTQSYDAMGRYRTVDPETKGPVDTTAEIVRLGEDIDGLVANVTEVAVRFSKGRRAPDCVVQTLARYTLDHNPDVENSCQIQQVKDEFAQNGSFSQLFKSILTSSAFLTRDLSK
ncbi:MAG TPA: DUF1592 domain-containing protein [Polyangiaceae bacterium]|nr:DUF1592 domain-containing protein [Polyangiaceae bacterium]